MKHMTTEAGPGGTAYGYGTQGQYKVGFTKGKGSLEGSLDEKGTMAQMCPIGKLIGQFISQAIYRDKSSGGKMANLQFMVTTKQLIVDRLEMIKSNFSVDNFPKIFGRNPNPNLKKMVENIVAKSTTKANNLPNGLILLLHYPILPKKPEHTPGIPEICGFFNKKFQERYNSDADFREMYKAMVDEGSIRGMANLVPGGEPFKKVDIKAMTQLDEAAGDVNLIDVKLMDYGFMPYATNVERWFGADLSDVEPWEPPKAKEKADDKDADKGKPRNALTVKELDKKVKEGNPGAVKMEVVDKAGLKDYADGGHKSEIDGFGDDDKCLVAFVKKGGVSGEGLAKVVNKLNADIGKVLGDEFKADDFVQVGTIQIGNDETFEDEDFDVFAAKVG